MSAAAIIAIAVGVVIVLAAIAFVTLARRSDVRGAGALSAETRRRDAAGRESRPTDELVEQPQTRKEAEQAGQLARYGTAVATVEETAIAPWSPPDPEAIGVSRRQFFNRATVSLMSAGIGAFSAASFVAFLWPTATGGFGQPVNVGKIDDIKQGINDGQGFFYAPSARTWITAYPADALAKARAIYPPSIVAGHGAGSRRPLPEVSAPRLSRAAVRHQPVVRVPVPRVAVQPGRREEGRSRATRHGPLPAHRRRQR